MLNRTFVEQRINKSAAAAVAPPDDQLFELTNITVAEVSLVDRPANQVEFIVTKRAGAKDERKGQGMEDGKPSAFADLDKTDQDAARKAQEAEDKAQSDREKAILAAAEKASNPPAKEPDPPGTPPAEPPAGDPPVPPVVPPNAPPESDPPVVPSAAKADGASADEDVEKKGAKMSRARREQLKAARQVIDELLAAVEPPEGEGAAKAVDPPPPETKEEGQKADPPKAEPPAKEAPPATPPAAPATETAKAADNEELVRLRTLVEGLQKMVKDQGELLAKSQRPTDSNALSIEKAHFGRDTVSWPADLAESEERIKGRLF